MRLFLIKSTVLSIFCLFSIITVSQNPLDNKWGEKPKPSIIPDSLKNADAVMISQTRTIENLVTDLSTYKTEGKETARFLLKIQTKKGLDEFSYVFLNKYEDEKISILDARTIKPNGQVIEVNANDIKKVDVNYNNSSKYEHYRFSIPGVEVGDEIEIVYQIKKDHLILGRDVSLYTYLPTLYSKLTLVFTKGLIAEFLTLNNMDEPKFTDESYEVIYEWEARNLVDIYNEYNSIPTLKLPFVRFVIRELRSNVYGYEIVNLSENSWDELYQAYDRTYDDDNCSLSYLKKFISENIVQDENASPTARLIEVLKYIRDSIKVSNLDDDENEKSCAYFLENRIINHYNLHILYRRIFKALKIPFYVCFARDIYEGPFNPDFISPHLITDVFYAFKDENGSLRYIYPSTSKSTYELDEIPYYLAGTKAILVSKKNTNSLKTDANTVVLPTVDIKQNYRNRQAQVSFSTSNNLLTLNFRESFSGDISTLTRTKNINAVNKIAENDDFQNRIKQMNEHYILDTAFIEKQDHFFPYNYKINYSATMDNSLTRIDENIYSLPLLDWLDHYQPSETEGVRKLDYFARFEYQDKFTFLLNFDVPVEIMNADKLNVSVDNEFGSYSFNIRKLNDKSLLINSLFTIKKIYLKANEYDKLREINKVFKQVSNLNLLLKM